MSSLPLVVELVTYLCVIPYAYLSGSAGMHTCSVEMTYNMSSEH